MKPKQYVKKFDLEKTNKFNRDEFIKCFSEDFENLLKIHPKMSVKYFENDVSSLKMKFDNIFNGSAVFKEAAEKFWGYIYATIIGPKRNELFGDIKKARHEERYQNDIGYRISYDRKKQEQEYRKYEDELINQHMKHRLEVLKEIANEKIVEKFMNRAEKIARKMLCIPSSKSLTMELIEKQYKFQRPYTPQQDLLLFDDSYKFLKQRFLLQEKKNGL